MSSGWRPVRSEPPPARPPIFPGNEVLGKLSERLSLLSKIILSLALPAFVLLFLGYFVYLVYSPAYRLSIFRTPKSLEADGYTGETLRDAFAFQIHRIEERSRTAERRLSHLETSEPRIDFQILSTSFSFQGLVESVRDAIGPGDVVVAADLVKNGARYEMFAMITDPRPLRTDRELSSSGSSLDAVIADTALRVVAALDPTVAGNYRAEVCREKRPGTSCTRADISDALADLKLALSQANDDRVRYRALLSLARLYAIVGEHSIARRYGMQATEISGLGLGPEAYELVGVEDTALGAHTEATSMFQRVLAQDPKAWHAHYDLANDWAARGDEPDDWAAAIREYEAALEIWPDNVEARAKLGYAFYKSGYAKDAVECLTEVVLFEPDNAQYHNDLANAIREKSQHPDLNEQQHGRWCATLPAYPSLDEAVTQHRVAIQLAHDRQDALWESYAHLDLGKTLEANQNVSAAERELKDAIKVRPGDSLAVHELAQLYSRAGRCSSEADVFADAAVVLEQADSQTCRVLEEEIRRPTTGACKREKSSEEVSVALRKCRQLPTHSR
jgi:tetratricopeptide (TPR) repeat protein